MNGHAWSASVIEPSQESKRRRSSRFPRGLSFRVSNVVSSKRAGVVLLVALALCVLEGALRKWVIGDQASRCNWLAYFSKDLAFGLILLFPNRRVMSPAMAVFRAWLIPGLGLLIFGIALSSLRGWNLVGAGLTLRATIVLPTISYLAVTRVSGFQVSRAAWVIGVLVIMNCGLGLVQNRLPADHVLNQYVASETVVV